MKTPYVSSEGGPLIIADHLALANWQGCEGDGSDYEKACDAVPFEGVGSIGSRLLVWDIGGPGTAFLINHQPGHFSMIRVWADDEIDDQVLKEALAR